MGKPVDELAIATERYDNGYYQEQLKCGQEFEDFVHYELHKRGIILGPSFRSRESQLKYGENLFGAEIKYDKKFQETKNLYVEVAEKSHPKNKTYVQSGIFRGDNSWLFIIGDYTSIWIFSTGLLRQVYGTEEFRQIETPTSIGFLVPEDSANDYAALRIDVTEAKGNGVKLGGKAVGSNRYGAPPDDRVVERGREKASCPKCGSYDYVDVNAADGKVRRDCDECGFFKSWTRW